MTTKDTQDATPVKVFIQRRPGPVVHTIGEYVWEEANAWRCAVDIDTAANLIAYPRDVFYLGEKPTAAVRKALADRLGVRPENIVVPGEPIIRFRSLESIVGPRAPEFVANGVTTVEQLAALDDAGVERLALYTGASRSEIEAWRVQAQA